MGNVVFDDQGRSWAQYQQCLSVKVLIPMKYTLSEDPKQGGLRCSEPFDGIDITQRKECGI